MIPQSLISVAKKGADINDISLYFTSDDLSFGFKSERYLNICFSKEYLKVSGVKRH